MSDRENHNYCTQKFVELANELKKEGMNIQLVSAALMSAAGIYAKNAIGGSPDFL